MCQHLMLRIISTLYIVTCGLHVAIVSSYKYYLVICDGCSYFFLDFSTATQVGHVPYSIFFLMSPLSSVPPLRPSSASVRQ
jgi:hypothetical protein